MLLREEKRIKNEKSSYFILNIEYITISHYFKIIKIYNDDSIKESDWIFIFSENDKIIHLKRLTEAKTEYKTTNEKRVINYSDETKINKDSYPIIKTDSTEFFDLWFIFPIYKTVYYDKISGTKVIEKKISKKKNNQF